MFTSLKMKVGVDGCFDTLIYLLYALCQPFLSALVKQVSVSVMTMVCIKSLIFHYACKEVLIIHDKCTGTWQVIVNCNDLFSYCCLQDGRTEREKVPKLLCSVVAVPGP